MFNNIKETVRKAYQSIVSDEPMSDATADKVVVGFLLSIGLVLSALVFKSIVIVATLSEAAAVVAVSGGIATTSVFVALVISAIPLVIAAVIAYRYYTFVNNPLN